MGERKKPNRGTDGGILRRIGLMLVCLAILPLPGWLRPGVDLQEAHGAPAWMGLYQRDGGAQNQAAASTELLFVGDVMLGRGVLESNQPFKHVSRLLTLSDLTIGNFEGSLADHTGSEANRSTDDSESPIRLIAPRSAVQQLKSAGFDLVSLGNNHSLDGGPAGLAETASVLRRAGIGVVGAGQGEAVALLPEIRNVNGVRIAFFGIDAVRQTSDPAVAVGKLDWQPARWKPERIPAAIQKARAASDVVVVLVHWGDEYENRASPSQIDAGRLLIEAGADLVIGSHPHVIQPTEIVEVDQGGGKRRGFVAYSLGNFVFDQNDPRTKPGLALKVRLDRQGVAEVEALVFDAGTAPRLPLGAPDPNILRRIKPKPAQVMYRCGGAGCEEVETGPAGDAPRFASGKIDLTGDGVAETVILRDSRITIYEGQNQVWESPPEWQVMDAALGDPNGDGRAEVALALLKPDAQGELKSHPFLIGYRGGIYRQVWGGSAVHFPILELDLLDVDQEGIPELVVLEQRAGDQTALTLWRWQGWVFSQVWSSREARLHNLETMYDHAGIPLIRVERDW